MGILSGLFKPNVKSMENRKDIDGLIKCLKHKNVDVQRRTAGALGRLRDPRAVEALIEILTDTTFFHIEETLFLHGDVARALGEIGDERAVEALESAARREFSTIGSRFRSLEEYAREAEKSKRKIDYLKEAVKEALDKIKAKKS